MRLLVPALVVTAGVLVQHIPSHGPAPAVVQAAAGWTMSTVGGTGFQATRVDEGCLQGPCLLLSGPPSPAAGSFGNLFRVMTPDGNMSWRAGRGRTIQLAGLPGLSRRVRFRAAVRVEGGATSARLWLRMDRRGAPSSFRYSPDITAADWRDYRIEADVPPDCRQVTVGFLLFGSGKAWVDAGGIEHPDEPVIKPMGRSAVWLL